MTQAKPFESQASAASAAAAAREEREIYGDDIRVLFDGPAATHHAMSDTQRCEPPEHLRGVDGWHRVALPTGGEDFARWVAEPQTWEAMPRTELWFTTASEAGIFGYRYVAPVTPPSTVAALVEALEGLLADTQHATHDCGDEDCPVRRARAALALYRGEVA